MRKWAQRAIGLLAGVGGLWNVLERLLGLPGYISDANTWFEWADIMDISIIGGFVILGGGVALGTSEWWWPRLRRKRAIIGDTAEADDAAVKKLGALVLVIERQISMYQSRTLSNAAMLPLLMSFPGEFRADHLKLTTTLDALGIPSPPDDASRDDWYFYLTRLKVFVVDGNLIGARELYVSS